MQVDRTWAKVSILAGIGAVMAMGAWAGVGYADPPAADNAKKEAVKTDADLVKEAIAAFKNEDKNNRDFMGMAGAFAQRLIAGSDEKAKAEAEAKAKAEAEARAKAEADSKKLALEVLKAKGEFTTDKAFLKLVDQAAKKNAPLAARWLLQFARSWRMAGQADKPRHIAVGQVSVEDGKLDPTLILAQMQVLDNGYFASEVGDLKKPLVFRAHGYLDMNVPLENQKGDVLCLGTIKLKAVPKDKQATLRGKITADGKPDFKKVTAVLNMSVTGINTPGNYYMPRPRWPEPVKITVKEDGEFTISGLSPTQYELHVSCEGLSDFSKPVTFKEGQTQDVGDCHLTSTDIGFYVDAKAPEAKELVWEKDFEAALEKAAKEKKPIMVMNTATWCGWCKVLESKVFTDAWIQKFMSPFIVVKAFEDKKLMEKWGVSGFPTLVFTDSKGEMKHKVVGYEPSMEFAADLAKALKALEIKPCEEMQKLIDKKVLKLD